MFTDVVCKRMFHDFTEKRQTFTENMLSGQSSGVTLRFC